jgi:hypothetical protein
MINQMKYFTILWIIFLCPYIYSQNYTRCAGLRGGNAPGLTYRQYIDDESAFEAIISYARGGLRLTALKQYNRPAFYKISDNLNFIYGYGAHVGLYYTNKYKIFYKSYRLDNWRYSPVFGLDGYLGLEYEFREFPFVIGIDIKPFFEFSTSRFFYIFLDDTALSLKFRF